MFTVNANLPFWAQKKPCRNPTVAWDARATQSTFNTGQQPFGPKLFKGSFRSLNGTTFKRKEGGLDTLHLAKGWLTFANFFQIFLFFACSFLLPNRFHFFLRPRCFLAPNSWACVKLCIFLTSLRGAARPRTHVGFML